MQSNRAKGILAEWLAVMLLRLKGYEIIGQRLKGFKGSGIGEIDILARKKTTLVIVEVKARKSHEDAFSAILPSQKKRLIKAAKFILTRYPEWSHYTVRFDAIFIIPYHLPYHIVDAWRI